MAEQNPGEMFLVAIETGDIEAARVLIAEKAHLSWNYGDTPLSKAAESGQLEIVRLLLDARVPVDLEDEEDGDPGSNRTALSAAAANGQIAIAQLLIQRGADVNHASAPLVNASHDLAMTKLLVEAGANPEQADEEGREAIVYAAESGHPEVVQFLAQAAGWEHNEDLEELLRIAREAGEEDEEDD